MEQKVSVWKANLQSGLILGLVSIVYSLIMWFLDQTLNRSMGWIFFLVIIGLIFYFIKSYRDNYLKGYITYGQSVSAGVIIFLYYSIIAAIFTYVLYSYIDTGLSAKMHAMSEEMLIKRGTPESAMGPALEMAKKFQQPWILAISTVIWTMLLGTVLSLIISIFTKKEGNPLLDSPENN